MTRTALAGPRPWHLIGQGIRDALLAQSRVNVTTARMNGNYPHAEAMEAAFQALRDAAPYPDEALAFEMHTEYACRLHVELVGFHPDEAMNGYAIVREIATGETHYTLWPCLSPLTIAAHDALTGGFQ